MKSPTRSFPKYRLTYMAIAINIEDLLEKQKIESIRIDNNIQP